MHLGYQNLKYIEKYGDFEAVIPTHQKSEVSSSKAATTTVHAILPLKHRL
jgi:hypothetical protein